MYRKRILTPVITIAVLWAALPSSAEGVEYFADRDTKLARGMVNTATGWLEVPKQTAIGGQEAGARSLIGGFFKGVALGAARTLVGGYEIATFLAPAWFEPVMKPATVFGGR